MSTQLYALLHVLADAKFHSGDALGQELGVGRSAIWKTMKKIPGLGLELHAVKGKGYRLTEALELLDREQILSPLPAAVKRKISVLQLFMSVNSTNAWVMNKIQEGSIDLSRGKVLICLAEQQTAGRGRRGRPWVSPFGHNIYLTLARSFNSGAAELEGLSLVIGLALLRVLKRNGVPSLTLKWPNDLYWQGRKLAGILLEMTGDLSGECQLLVGLGLNLKMPAQAAAGIDQPWADLSAIHPALPGRNSLAAAIIREFMDVLEEFESCGFSGFRQEWLEADMLLNRPVELKKNMENNSAGITGICRGVNAKGAILVETAKGLEAFHAGELSARMVTHDDT